MKASCWLGYDPRERDAYAVARSSLLRHSSGMPDMGIRCVGLEDLRSRGLYTRPTEVRDGVMWDLISGAPQSTEHANARFLTPHLAQSGWALFCDCDVLFRTGIRELFRSLDPRYAAYCVKHNHDPTDETKMDGQIQTRYQRKNWSSVVAFNCGHPSNAALTVEAVNTLPGRDLHRFFWLEDHQIGALDPGWNYLVGVSEAVSRVHIAHFTLGTPDMAGYEDCEFADEWRSELALASTSVGVV